MYSRIYDHSYFSFSVSAIVLQNNQTEQEIYVIFGIILYKYNNIIDKYLMGKNAWKVDDQRLMFVLKIWVYRHDLNKYLSCDENIIINLITLQWIIFSGTKFLGQIFSWVKITSFFKSILSKVILISFLFIVYFVTCQFFFLLFRTFLEHFFSHFYSYFVKHTF